MLTDFFTKNRVKTALRVGSGDMRFFGALPKTDIPQVASYFP